MPHLHYFRSYEFREWFDDMDPRLLVMLDSFRNMIECPVHISPHPKALGRASGDTQHNFMKWGEVRAVDIFPENMVDRFNASRNVRFARKVGFTGIGIYPHWARDGVIAPGMHLDTRRGVSPGSPATWGAVKDNPHDPEESQRYVSMDYALDRIPE